MTTGSASGGDSRSVFAAGVSRGPWWVLVHQANSSLEDFEEVRKAWGGLVKKSEAGPTVAEGERAIGLVVEADLQDSKMMKRFVNLIRALRITRSSKCATGPRLRGGRGFTWQGIGTKK